MFTPITAIGQPDPSTNQASGSGTIQSVTQAIKQASVRTGVDFSYLLNKASQESGFDPNAKASSSSATGLFQFTSQTWLQMMKSHGTQFGLGAYASDISVDSNGVASVSDPSAKKAILALRNDPTVSAEMAGELDQQNMSTLQSNVGGKIGPTDLYLAHFLGAGGATSFIDAMRSNPNASAASVLPEAAASNPSVFYDKSGAPRSLHQIYQHFAQKFDHDPVMPKAATAMASATPTVTTTVADASSVTAQSPAYTPSVMSAGIKPAASPLYSSLVLAQMDLKDSTSSWGSNAVNGHKKTTIPPILLGTIA